MRRLCCVILVGCLVLTFATLATAGGRRSHYTFTSLNQFADPANLFAYMAPTADGWLISKHLQIVGDYTRTLKGRTESGDLKITVGGRISADFANAQVYGLVSLDLDGGVSCAGWFSGKRVDYLESIRMLMSCTDGTFDRSQFEFLADPTALEWEISGTGTVMAPRN